MPILTRVFCLQLVIKEMVKSNPVKNLTFNSFRFLVSGLHYLDPIRICISLFIGCFVETRNYSVLSLAFITISFRVTEENLVFDAVQAGPYSSYECFLCS